MKKILFMTLISFLVLQMVAPYISKAVDTENSGAKDALTLSKMEQVSGEQANTYDFTIHGHITNTEATEVTKHIDVSENVTLSVKKDGQILDAQNKQIATYQIADNTIQIKLPAKTDTDITFTVTTKYKEAQPTKEKDIVTFTTETSNLQDEVTLTKTPEKQQPETQEPAEQPKDNVTKQEPKANTKETKKPTEKPAIQSKEATQNKLAADEPQDVKDIFASLGYSDEDATILTGMDITYFDPDGNPVDNPEINDTVHFAFTWAIPDDVGAEINAGDYYRFEMPDTIKIVQNQDISLGEYGTVEVRTDGTVTFVFTDAVHEHSNVHGTVEFDTQLNEDEIDGPGDITIKIPFEDNLPEIDVNVKPTVDSTIDKSGYFDKEVNPDYVNWQVDINKALDTIDTARVNENFPPGLTYQSVKVYKVQVDLKGEVYDDSEELVTSGYTVDANGNVTFTTPISDAYRLKYVTKIDDDVKPEKGGNVAFENSATLVADGTELPAKASVTAYYGKLLTKQATNYNPSDQTYQWSVKYNYGEKEIATNDALIHDTFGNSQMQLVDGSVQLYKVTFAPDGTEIQGDPLVEGVDYEIVPTATGFDIQFLHPIDYAVKITYKTSIDGIVDSNLTINNTVTTDSGESSDSSGGVEQQNVIKNIANVDYDTKEVTWKVDINQNRYEMINWQMTDQLSPGLTFQTGSFVMKDMVDGNTLVENQDYTLTYDEANNRFTVAFIGTYARTDHNFQITYVTDFNTSVDGVDDPDRTFPNTATTTWRDGSDQDHSSSDGATFDPSDAAKYDGFKSGSYNATTSRITWTIGINYDVGELKNAQVSDPIQGNQQYVDNSVKIYHYTVEPDGTVVKGAEVDNYGDFVIDEPSEANNETLTVRFPNDESAAYLVEFKTSLAGQIVMPTYDNDAVFSNDTYPEHHLTAEVSVANGGDFVTKNGYQDENGFVHWSVTVNPSQSTMNDVVVTDTPSSNQVIDPNSIVVYRTVVKPDGTIVKSPYLPLKEGTDYTVTIESDPVTGQQEMKVAFLHQIDSSYIIEYRAFVFIKDEPNQKVTNSATVSGNNEVTINDGDNSSVDIVVLNGSGTAVGEAGSITFEKVNAQGQPLTGAQFQLWDKNKALVLREGTVDATGELVFGNLPYGDYILQEVKAPAGYTISDELATGKTVTVDANTSAADATPIEIVNTPNKVTLEKEGPNSEVLAGAQFQLEQQLNNEWIPVETDPLITDATGKLEIDGLLPGSYRLIETVAPSGYIVDTTPIPFDITTNDAGQIPDVALDPFINYQGSIEAIKQDDTGKSLAGAIFEVKDQNQIVVKRVVSGRDGHIEVANLAPGDYQLVELRAPRGYIKNTAPVPFTIPEQQAGKPETIQLGALINYQGSVQLTKKDPNNNTLAGAKYALYQAEGTLVDDQLTTDKAGIIKKDHLAPGSYYFQETKAPQGYLLNKAKIPFEITAENNDKPAIIQLEAVNKPMDNNPPTPPTPPVPPTPTDHGQNGGQGSNSGTGTNHSNLTSNQAVIDTQQANTLPETGDTNTSWWWVIIGLTCIGLGGRWLFKQTKKAD